LIAIINATIMTNQAQVTAPVHHKKASAMMANPRCRPAVLGSQS
jgi:hypothetical protein